MAKGEHRMRRRRRIDLDGHPEGISIPAEPPAGPEGPPQKSAGQAGAPLLPPPPLVSPGQGAQIGMEPAPPAPFEQPGDVPLQQPPGLPQVPEPPGVVEPPRPAWKEPGVPQGFGQEQVPDGGLPPPPPPPPPPAVEEAGDSWAPETPPDQGPYPPPYSFICPPPTWFPPGYGAPPGAQIQPGAGYGYEYGAGQPYYPDQTGQAPVVPMQAVPPPGFPQGFPAPMEGQPYPPVGMIAVEPSVLEDDFGFRDLAEDETHHWGNDFKWIFGIITAVLLFTTLTLAGFYRITGSRNARSILVPLIEQTTQVEKYVKANYNDLQREARKKESTNIDIPDIGVDVRIGGETIITLSSDDLADKVVTEVQRKIYSQGYKGNLPMKSAAGVGEERGKAVCVTLLSLINRKTNERLMWLLIIFGGLSVAFGIVFVVFCRSWGQAIGLGLVSLTAALPGSLLIRLLSEFSWRIDTSGTYKPAMHHALRAAGGLMLAYYDIALGAGALLLLVGVVGCVISHRAKERIKPFMELEEPVETVAGGPPVDAELRVGGEQKSVPDIEL